MLALQNALKVESNFGVQQSQVCAEVEFLVMALRRRSGIMRRRISPSMHTLVKKQREYFDTNTTKSVAFRVERLKQLRSLLKENQQALYEAIYSDYKKSSFDCFVTELIVLNSDLELAIRKVSAWSRKRRPR